MVRCGRIDELKKVECVFVCVCDIRVHGCMCVSMLQWSPNGRLLLFGTSTGDVFIHDSAGDLIVSICKLGRVPMLSTFGK